MGSITIEGHTYAVGTEETVLQALERNGVTVPSSCRNGICQTCLMQATKGNPPSPSQNGLKETLRAQGYFLSCVCKPNGDLTVVRVGEEVLQKCEATIIEKAPLNSEIFRFRLIPHTSFTYRAGQFLHLHRPDGLIRSYSIASVPDTENSLELHVRHLKGGAMTSWLIDSAKVGESINISGPAGNCFYIHEKQEQNMLLIGTGSGLAPLWGILKDALHHDHSGNILLYHGSWNPEGLYLESELCEYARLYPNFSYIPCADISPTPRCVQGQVHKVALAQHPKLKDWRVFLCGHPGMVATMKRQAYLAGASLSDIYSDPFVLSTPSK